MILRRWFELIVEHTEPLAQLMTAEQGKPLAEARGEVAYGAAFVEFFAEEAKRIHGEVHSHASRQRPYRGAETTDRRRRRDHALEFPAWR